jgi:type II secretory pathway component PulJ
MGAPRGAKGFTMIEMLGVLLLSALVLTVAVDAFLDLSRQSRVSVERTRAERRTVGTVDRIARDLGAAVLVTKPAELDPLEHPWLFLGEARDERAGADRIKFTMRGHATRASQVPESDLAVVAYVLRGDGDGGGELLRWSSPRLPEGLDRSFPATEEDGARVLLDGIGSFGVRFQNEDGEWTGSWDSSTLLDSSELPVAVEVSLALAPEPGTPPELAPPPVVRRVVLPLRPLDLQALLGEETGDDDDAEDGEEDGDESDEARACVTVAQCMERNPAAFQGIDPSVIASMRNLCVSDVNLAVNVEGCQ